MATVLDLSPLERKFGKFTGAISTATYFAGSIETILPQIRGQVEKILQSNPWLAGRLKAKPLRLVVPAASGLFESFFTFVEVEALLPQAGRDAPVSDYLSAGYCLRQHGVPVSGACVGRDAPLFRVAVLSCKAEGIFCVHLSVSHLLVDGLIFYQLHEALSPGAVVQAFDPTRVFEGVMDQRSLGRLYGHKMVAFQFDPTAFAASLSGLAWHNAKQGLRGRRRPPRQVVEVDPAWVAAQKEAAGGGIISTNDILASWYFREGGFEGGLICMDMRWRGPDEDGPPLTNAHAGNYVWPMQFGREDFSPAAIRSALTRRETEPRYVTRRNKPLTRSSWFGLKVGSITTWAKIYRELELPAATHLAHVPTSTGMSGFPTAVVFCPRRDALAVMLDGARRPRDAPGAKASSPSPTEAASAA